MSRLQKAWLRNGKWKAPALCALLCAMFLMTGFGN